MSNNLRTRNGVPFNFVDGLKINNSTLHGVKYPFAGNGTNTNFVLPVVPFNKDCVDIFVKQLYIHSSDYELVGETVILNEAPPSLDIGETHNVEIKVSFILV